MLRILTLLTVFLNASAAFAAINLPPLSDGKDNPLPIKTGQPPIACDQIVNSMVAFNQMAQQHESSLTAFLSDVSTKISGWYTLLSPLEGTAQTIPAGTFATLQDGATKISNITDQAFDNSDLLAQELDHIITSLRACSITAPVPPPK